MVNEHSNNPEVNGSDLPGPGDKTDDSVAQAVGGSISEAQPASTPEEQTVAPTDEPSSDIAIEEQDGGQTTQSTPEPDPGSEATGEDPGDIIDEPEQTAVDPILTVEPSTIADPEPSPDIATDTVITANTDLATDSEAGAVSEDISSEVEEMATDTSTPAPVPEAEAVTEVEPEAEAVTEVEAESEAVTEVEPEPEAITEIEVVTEVEAEPDMPQVEAEPEAVTEVEAEPEAVTEIEAEPEAVTEVEAEPDMPDVEPETPVAAANVGSNESWDDAEDVTVEHTQTEEVAESTSEPEPKATVPPPSSEPIGAQPTPADSGESASAWAKIQPILKATAVISLTTSVQWLRAGNDTVTGQQSRISSAETEADQDSSILVSIWQKVLPILLLVVAFLLSTTGKGAAWILSKIDGDAHTAVNDGSAPSLPERIQSTPIGAKVWDVLETIWGLWAKLLGFLRDRVFPESIRHWSNQTITAIVAFTAVFILWLSGMMSPSPAQEIANGGGVAPVALDASPEVDLPIAPPKKSTSPSKDETLATSIQEQLTTQLGPRYSDEMVQTVAIDRPHDRLTVMLGQDWYDLSEAKQQQLAQKIWSNTQEQSFSHLTLVNLDGVRIARDPVVGSDMLLFQTVPPVIEPPVIEPPVIEPPVIEPPAPESAVVESPIVETPDPESSVIETPLEEIELNLDESSAEPGEDVEQALEENGAALSDEIEAEESSAEAQPPSDEIPEIIETEEASETEEAPLDSAPTEAPLLE